MDEQINKVTEVCKSRFESLKKSFSNTNSVIIISHFGGLTQEMVNDISVEAEEYILKVGDKKGVVKRVFNILVEGLQNTRLHGERDLSGNQTSFICICKEENYYKINIGNLIKNEHVNSISQRINNINSNDLISLKKIYVDTLTNGVISKKGGAGLGFITIALKSKNKLNIYLDKINNDLTCFTLGIMINRN